MRLRKRDQGGAALATQLRSQESWAFPELGVPLGGAEAHVYQSLRSHVPILDAAVGKLTQLVGGFAVSCGDRRAQRAMDDFLQHMNVGRGQTGMESFLSAYVGSLFTFGRAVGEMVVSPERLEAVVWGDVTRLEVRQGASPLAMVLCAAGKNGTMEPLPRQELLLFSTRNPEAANPYGVSLFRGMPALAGVLMKIYETIGRNWERAGNIRYSVVYKPGADGIDRGMAAERSRQMAEQWSAAMQDSHSGTVRDFVAVGDVEIKVIGADGPVLESEVPVRQLLEQLVAKTGLPPFLLGLSWSTTERMSQQQADMLTTELWAVRRVVTPVIEKICGTFLRLGGYGGGFSVDWEEICLQDLVEEAKARLYRAQAERLEKGERT